MAHLLANTVSHLLQIVFNLPLNISAINAHFIRDLLLYIGGWAVLCVIAMLCYAFRIVNGISAKVCMPKQSAVLTETQGFKQFGRLGVLVCLVWLLAILAMVLLEVFEPLIIYPIWTGLSVLAFWMAFSAIKQARRLRKHILSVSCQSMTHPSTQCTKYKPKYFYALNSVMRSHRLFLNPTVQLKDVAQVLHLSEGYISQLINRHSGLNFNEYVNSFRIEEAKRLLHHKDYVHYTIMAIGLESGFNSRSSFYRAFKHYVGQTPKEFRKLVPNL